MPTYGVLDCETTLLANGQQPRTLFWGVATENGGYRSFKTTRDLSIFLHTEQTEPLYLLHHGNFDIIQLLLDGVQSLNILRSHNAKLIMCKWGNHLLLNSLAMFPVKLETLFNAFGYKKTSLDNLEQRNYEDCVNGLDVFLRMDDIFRELVCESPLTRHTVASTAFHAAERIAGKLPKCLDYLESYRGGRCEVFDTREIMASKYDINSSYPFSFVDAPERSNLLYIEVRSDDWHCPLFDANEQDRLLFPSGKFSSWVFEDTLEKYIRPNWSGSFVVKESIPIDLSWLKRVAPLVQKLYDLKAKSDGGLKETCKFLLNSMYGRIGLKGISERCRILEYIPDGDDITCCQLGNYGKYIVWDKRQMSPRSNYPLAAYITDNARGRLFAAIKQTQASYVDTDSSFTNSGNSPSPRGTELGQWKFEGEETFCASNLKDYRWAEKRYVKGGEKNMQWSLKKAMQGKGAFEVEKHFTTALRKRILNKDGTTEPMRVGT